MKTRFAPSPTGYLHRGHIWSALQVWASAEATASSVLLRMEDHDQSRCRPQHITAIRQDLEWLGFEWQTESIQSQRSAIYEKALQTLAQNHLLYNCDCSRAHILQNSTPCVYGSGEFIYNGRCQKRQIPDQIGHSLRLKLPTPSLITWQDLRLGTFHHHVNLQCGDLLLKDRLGQWTYQFAVAVDDFFEGIDFVIRGEDLLYSTARQILLGQLLGRSNPPIFLHHSLLYDSTGKKLSKRQLSTSIRSERDQGISAEQLLGEVCFESGLIPTCRPLEIKEALTLVRASLPSTIASIIP